MLKRDLFLPGGCQLIEKSGTRRAPWSLLLDCRAWRELRASMEQSREAPVSQSDRSEFQAQVSSLIVIHVAD